MTSLISPDGVVGADAGMIVGLIFLLTMQQALNLRITYRSISALAFPMSCFGCSLAVLVSLDIAVSGLGLSDASSMQAYSQALVISKVLLLVGVFLTFLILQGVYRQAFAAVGAKELVNDLRKLDERQP